MAIDIIFAVIVVYGFYLGFNRGIIRTVLTLVAYFFGLLFAFRFAPDATRFLEQTFGEQPLMIVAGFISTFLLAVLAIRLIIKGLEGILQTANINLINRIAGGLLVASTFVLLYSILLNFADRSRILTPTAKNTSYTYSYLEEYPAYAWAVGQRITPVVVDFYDYTIDFMDRMQELRPPIEKVEVEEAMYDPVED